MTAERPTPRGFTVGRRELGGGGGGAGEYDDYRIAALPEAGAAASGTPLPRATPPSTVIPVPALPVADASHRSRMEPVVRSAQSAAASRLAKGTGPVDPDPSASETAASPPLRAARNGRAAAAIVVEDTVTDLSVGDRTKPGVPLPATRRMPAVKADELIAATVPATDPTRPGIGLPPAARAVALPSIKRRTVR